MRNMASVVCRRRVEDDEGQQGCAIVLLSDNTIQYEFKNGKGKGYGRVPVGRTVHAYLQDVPDEEPRPASVLRVQRGHDRRRRGRGETAPKQRRL